MKKHCPNCLTEIPFARIDYRICDTCGWKGHYTDLVEKPKVKRETKKQ